MTEQEYMDATDLARIRSASNVLIGMFCSKPSDLKTLRNALRALDRLEESLRARVMVEFPLEHGQRPSK